MPWENKNVDLSINAFVLQILSLSMYLEKSKIHVDFSQVLCIIYLVWWWCSWVWESVCVWETEREEEGKKEGREGRKKKGKKETMKEKKEWKERKVKEKQY